MRLIMQTGKPISAEQASKAQIVDRCVKVGQARQLALATAKDYADLPPLAYAKVKQQIRGPVITVLQEQIDKAVKSKPEEWFTTETSVAMARMIGDAAK